MPQCACFSSALQISDQLQRTESGLAYASFDQILTVARRASAICHHYAACTLCSDPSYYTIYVVILRKAANFYAHSVRSSSLGSSPGTASTSSGGSLGSYGSISRLRIGSFEIEAPLDEQTRAIILRTELRRAAEAASLLESLLGPHTTKPGLLHADEATHQYQRGLVSGLRDEISNLEGYLQMM